MVIGPSLPGMATKGSAAAMAAEKIQVRMALWLLVAGKLAGSMPERVEFCPGQGRSHIFTS